jgi:hypothetical protein
MTPVSGIVAMNIAGMDTGDLALMKGAMIIGLAVELDPAKRDEALEIVDLIEAEQAARRDPGAGTQEGTPA